MAAREDQFGCGVPIPATTARLVDQAIEIMGDPEPDELAFLHSVLAQCFITSLSMASWAHYSFSPSVGERGKGNN